MSVSGEKDSMCVSTLSHPVTYTTGYLHTRWSLQEKASSQLLWNFKRSPWNALMGCLVLIASISQSWRAGRSNERWNWTDSSSHQTPSPARVPQGPEKKTNAAMVEGVVERTLGWKLEGPDSRAVLLLTPCVDPDPALPAWASSFLIC